jgi:hypothetical protein
MYCTFSIEPSYGTDSISQDHVVDLVSEAIVDNLNYEKAIEFNHPTAQGRIPTIKTVSGRVEFDLTYNNEAWNILFQTLLGQRLRLTNFSLALSSEKWNVVTGMLESDLNATSISFNITEYKQGEFDNVDGIIVNGEYIAISTINNGVVTGSIRASEGSTASSHNQHALVYGVKSTGGSTLDIISRYRNGFCYSLPTSITFVIYRDGTYFKFNGIQFQDFIFNAKPMEGVKASFMAKGKDGGTLSLGSPSETVDNNVLVDTDHISCFSMGEGIDIAKLYFETSNTLSQSSAKFLSDTYGKMILGRFSTYGQFTAVEETTLFYEDYKNDVKKNLSMTLCNKKDFDKGFVFAFNDIRFGTMMHVLRTSMNIDDSIPFYCYGENDFTILIQN